MAGTVTTDGERFVLAFPYNPGMTKDLKRRVPGSDYDKKTYNWSVPTMSAVPLLDFVNDHRMRMAPPVRRLIEECASRERALTELSAAHDDLEAHDLLPGVPLKPYQRAAVTYALRTRRCFIADEMGLGKTLSAIAAVHAADAFPALVICPALLKVNWQREVAHWFPGTTTEVLYGRKPRRVPPVEFVIANYDIVAAWEEHLIAGGFQSIVLDESHNIRNTNARSLSVRRVARKVPETGLRLALSGTPVWLQARDLWHQLDALGRQDQMGGWPFFNRRYVKSKHPEELHERLRATCYVRRVKADVMSELPAKTRAPQWLQPADLTEYRKAEADLIAYVQERAARIAAELGENPKSAAVRAKFKAQAAPDLVRIAALKRLAAEAKIGDAAKWIGDFLETGKKLVVFAHHRSVLDTLAAKLGADVVVGGQGDKARQAAVDRFQSDPSAKVLVCALTAAGVGITLTAASDVLFLELGWTAAGHDQCEDRCHRIGQHDNVTAWYMLADGTIDADNWNLLAERRAEMEAVTDGQVSQTRDTHMGVSLLMRMAGIGDDDVPGVDDDLFLLDDEGEAA